MSTNGSSVDIYRYPLSFLPTRVLAVVVLSVCLIVRLSQVRVLLKRLNVAYVG